MKRKNPSYTERQRLMMCADYSRAKHGKKTRTGMKKKDLRDFCQKPVVPKKQRKGKWMKKVRQYRKTHKKNPHLSHTGAWRFIGMFKKADIGSVKRMMRIHGIKMVVTKDMAKGELGMRELYVVKDKFDFAYRAITRLFEGMKVA